MIDDLTSVQATMDDRYGQHQDFLDFPTAWHIQRQGLDHTDSKCSAVQAAGALLCDCGAVQAEWERLRAEETFCNKCGRVGTRGEHAESSCPYHPISVLQTAKDDEAAD